MQNFFKYIQTKETRKEIEPPVMPQDLWINVFVLLDTKEIHKFACISLFFNQLSDKLDISKEIRNIIKTNWTYYDGLLDTIDLKQNKLISFNWSLMKMGGTMAFNSLIDLPSSWVLGNKMDASKYLYALLKSDLFNKQSAAYLLELLLYMMLKSNECRTFIGTIAGENASKDKIFKFGDLDKNILLIAKKAYSAILALPHLNCKASLMELCLKIQKVPENKPVEIDSYLKFEKYCPLKTADKFSENVLPNDSYFLIDPLEKLYSSQNTLKILNNI